MSSDQPVPDHPALTSALITYIGNKRKLLGLINRGIDRCRELADGAVEGDRSPARDPTSPDGAAGGESSSARHPGSGDGEPADGAVDDGSSPWFLDLFSGSGVVGRLARLRGYRVWSNDAEDYTRPFGTAFLTIGPDEVEKMFRPAAIRLGLSTADGQSYRAVLAYLNSLNAPTSANSRYFSVHYAPKSTADADFHSERLFYSQENALKIDAILECVNRADTFPPTARDVVLAGLLVEMSVHVNTSGVMKGYHNGWGGRGADALSRIMAPVELEPLPLIDGPSGRVSVEKASNLLASGELPAAEIAYLDPPYNIHQYGANYHLLTSAVRYDFYDPGPVGNRSRAGIRTDHYRSDFCRQSKNGSGVRRASAAMRAVLKQIDARFLLVSYNDEGIIPGMEMVRMLSEYRRHTVELLTQEHIKFRGGKNTQSSRRTTEYLFVVHRNRPQDAAEVQALEEKIRRLTLERRLVDSYIDPERWHAPDEAPARLLSVGDRTYGSLGPDLRPEGIDLSGADSDELARIGERIDCASMDKPELLRWLIDHGEYSTAVDLLRSFKIRKYRTLFTEAATELAPSVQGRDRIQLEELVRRVLDSTEASRVLGEPPPNRSR